jgi:hypothetical protein
LGSSFTASYLGAFNVYSTPMIPSFAFTTSMFLFEFTAYSSYFFEELTCICGDVTPALTFSSIIGGNTLLLACC